MRCDTAVPYSLARSAIKIMPISLEKIERDAPRLIDLAKKADISILKANLTNHQAKVALCLDISGSMSFLYSSGKIQTLAEKILALGCRFDDNGYTYNAAFFNVEDPESISDDELYDILMEEYPSWVKFAYSKQLLK